MTSGGGRGGRAAAGAVRLGNAVGAAFTNRRVLEPVEARIMLSAGLLLLGLAAIGWFFPRGLAYPLVFLLLWISLALLYRAYKLKFEKVDQPMAGPHPLETANQPPSIESEVRNDRQVI